MLIYKMRKSVRKAKRSKTQAKRRSKSQGKSRVKSRVPKRTKRKTSKKKSKGKKRPPSAWNKHMMGVYKSMKSKDSSVKLGDAMKVAKKTYKKGAPAIISVD